MRKFTVFTLIVFSVWLSTGMSQTLNLRFNNAFYTWKRVDSLAAPNTDPTYTTHLKGYQNLAFDLNFGKWTISSFVQTDEDVVNKIDRGFSFRFYDAFIKGNNLFNALDLKLGRQYVTAGSGRGTIDGAHFKLKLGDRKQYQIIGYGGYLTPLAYDFEGYNKQLQDNFLAGGQFLYYGVKDLSVGLSYSMKRRAMDPYYTIRPDEFFNPKVVYIETESKSEQLAGADVSYRINKKHNVYGRAYYDINMKKLQKAEINGNFALMDNLKFSVGYYYKQPQLSYNTIFWVFNYKKYQEVEAGLDYTTKIFGTDANIYGRFGGVIYENDNSFKIQAGISNPWYGIGIVKYTGYSGESEGAFGYFNHDLYKSQLVLSSSLNYTRYNLGNYNTDKVDVFGGALGLTYRPVNHFSIDAQGQFMTNEIYKFDTRFLLGFNLWLFTKFNN